MAYEMPFTDERLTTHAESVWLPMAVGFDHGPKSGRITFNGYSSLAALGANAPVIAQHNYDVSGSSYEAVTGLSVGRLVCRLMGLDPADPSASLTAADQGDLVAALVACPILGLVSEACYDYAATVNDMGAEGEKVPFFDGAESFVLGV